VFGQRHLHQYSVYGWIIVELGDKRQKISLARLGGEFVLPRIHTDLNRLLGLVGDIDAGCWVFAHQHHGQAGGEVVGGFQR
jgi:hypothetical protein